MKRILTVCTLLASICGMTAADDEVLEKADSLYITKDHSQAINILEAALETAWRDREKAEIYWRLSRHTLDSGDILYGEGAQEDTLLPIYQQAREYADKTIVLAPDMHEGYYWKAASTGRWAKTKGMINALFEAKPMRDLLAKAVEIYPYHGESWYVLGMMYELLPGFPLSFGNKVYAVSLGRKSLEANRIELATGAAEIVRYSYYVELANHLWARDWNEAKREREHSKQAEDYYAATDILEKNFYYEGVVDIEAMSDREEAKNIVRWVIESIEALPDPIPPYISDLKQAKEVLDSWD